ncbi:hypothetical protein AB0F91_11330 [Amycolatopsis sp. NPDC023774]|uniref:hypothetical protein n=1 Tax=Amycolatopsis sp. NPDC023774 TaxID=3155015 RepID=UPI0033DF833B
MSTGLALAACSSSGETPAASGPAASGFPVDVKGVECTTRIPRPPQRVLSVGQYRESDAAVALGVVPLITPDLRKCRPGGCRRGAVQLP